MTKFLGEDISFCNISLIIPSFSTLKLIPDHIFQIDLNDKLGKLIHTHKISSDNVDAGFALTTALPLGNSPGMARFHSGTFHSLSGRCDIQSAQSVCGTCTCSSRMFKPHVISSLRQYLKSDFVMTVFLMFL